MGESPAPTCVNMSPKPRHQAPPPRFPSRSLKKLRHQERNCVVVCLGGKIFVSWWWGLGERETDACACVCHVCVSCVRDGLAWLTWRLQNCMMKARTVSRGEDQMVWGSETEEKSVAWGFTCCFQGEEGRVIHGRSRKEGRKEKATR